MARKPDVFRVIFVSLDDGARVVCDIYEANNVAYLYRLARASQRSAMKRTDLPEWCRPVEAKVVRLSRYTDRKGRTHTGKERHDARLSAAFSALYASAEA